jgi:hypothetical protein
MAMTGRGVLVDLAVVVFALMILSLVCIRVGTTLMRVTPAIQDRMAARLGIVLYVGCTLAGLCWLIFWPIAAYVTGDGDLAHQIAEAWRTGIFLR